MSDDIRILLASDPHYLSHKLTDNGPLFMRSVENGDGKLAELSPEILDEFLQTAMEQKPDLVIIPGDLTYNGERLSLQEVTDKLSQIRAAGIPVLVLPGNHDINYPYAFLYKEEKAFKAANISQADFQENCGDYGYHDAILKCASSFSYLYEIGADWYALCIDANTEAAPGRLDEETLRWMTEAFSYVREKGAHLILVSHQNILKHNPFMYKGFVIDNEEALAELLAGQQISAAFTGHCHMQNNVSNGRFTDYATGSLSVYPLQYAEILLHKDGTVTYRSVKLKNHRPEAKKRFDTVVRKQVEKTLTAATINPAARKRMLDFAVKTSETYFGGGKVVLSDVDEGWHAWKKYASENFWYYYFKGISE